MESVAHTTNRGKTAQKLRELAESIENQEDKNADEAYPNPNNLTRPELIRKCGELAGLDEQDDFFSYQEDNNIGFNMSGWRGLYAALVQYRMMLDREGKQK